MKTTLFEPHKSSIGIEANYMVIGLYALMALMSWIGYANWVSWALPLILWFAEKESAFVKRSAEQALAIELIRSAVALIVQICFWTLIPRGSNFFSAFSGISSGIRLWATVIKLVRFFNFIVLGSEIYIFLRAYVYAFAEISLIAPFTRKIGQILYRVNAGNGGKREQEEGYNRD